MATQGTPKRRRIVTACTECQRRKQKCDRESPCNICVARKVPNKCRYGGTLSSPYYDSTLGVDSEQRSISPEPNWQPRMASKESGHQSNLKYSHAVESNAFVGLHHILRDRDELNSDFGTHNNLLLHGPRPDEIRPFLDILPQISVIKEIVALYYLRFNPQYFFIERYYFDQLLSYWLGDSSSPPKYLTQGALSKELRSFPALLFQVLGLAIQFSPPDTPTLKAMTREQFASSQRYSDYGMRMLERAQMQSFSLTTVQAYLLRTSWLKNAGRGVESWHCLGIAIRCAQELGLHEAKDMHQDATDRVSETLCSFWYDEYKRRVWANLFIFDGLMALIFRRPRTINTDDCDAPKPLDCNMPTDPTRGVPFIVQPDTSSSTPTTTSATLFRYKLTCVVHEMRAQKTSTPYPRDYSIISRLNERLVAIIDAAPPFLRHRNPDTSWDVKCPYLPLQREELLSTANQILTFLHRPHIVACTESRQAALQAAIATLESQHRIFNQAPKHLHKLFGFSFCTIDAAILLSVMKSIDLPSREGAGQRVDHLLQQSMDRLAIMQEGSAVAKSGLQILMQIHQKLEEVHGAVVEISGLDVVATTDPEPVPAQQPVDYGSSSSDAFQTLAPVVSAEVGSEFSVLGSPGTITPVLNYFDNWFWLDYMSQIPPGLLNSLGEDFILKDLTFN
ncbi:fungal-specific transcription factor domain-containing protein [Truncatella angustata]|uniref:Fungal-specific transcription factor domain-containing protein n=1 Tax=Truncatella angustata TaxID=152316 RepID=A0A9P8ZWU2_9PEZI|nr:fungal-specific transcription factor domain-containing protein [Truncatella angustata]KAH6652442.1 fungal-specific transcription factor domain-containing protein [Truncatella angustata]